MTRPCHAASLPNVNRTRIDIHFPKISLDGHLNPRPDTTRVSFIPADTLELNQAEKMLNSTTWRDLARLKTIVNACACVTGAFIMNPYC